MTGDEHLFDLTNDPQELLDLSNVSKKSDRLELWRKRLVDILEQRPEDKLTKNGKLAPGANLQATKQRCKIE